MLITSCSVIWGNCSKSALNKHVKLQKRAARIILNKDYNSRTCDLFAELNWMSLEDRIIFGRAVQVYKCLNDSTSQCLDTLLVCSRVSISITPGQLLITIYILLITIQKVLLS